MHIMDDIVIEAVCNTMSDICVYA